MKKILLGVLREALYEFPVHEVNVNLPSWVMVLDDKHWLRQEFEQVGTRNGKGYSAVA